MVRSLADRTFQLRLPARVLLGTVDRSEPNVMRLATGLEITEARRPRGRLADPVWANYKKAQDAYAAVSPGDRPLLEAVLLAGGGDPEGLPPCLSSLEVRTDFCSNFKNNFLLTSSNVFKNVSKTIL